ncbi:MAG TPA: HEAT repeat domain-containing protein [Herpetosiphonaceae bacterium]
MPIPEPILGALVEAMFGYILDQSGVSDWVRDKLGRDPAKRGYVRALNAAMTTFEAEYPQAEDSLFDANFLECEAVPILAQFLIRDGRPDPFALADKWVSSLGVRDGERRATLVRERVPEAAHFLDLLSQALKAEPDLADLNDSRAFDHLSDDLAALRRRFGAEEATPATRNQYFHWLIERNLYLDPRGTMQTQRQVQVKLGEVYISLQAQREDTPGAVDRKLLEQELSELEARLTRMAIPAEEAEDQREHLLALLQGRGISASTGDPTETLELSEAVTLHDRLVVLGNPGSGKTTLARYLALKHAQALYNGRADAGDGLGPARFPILVRIADYAENDTWKQTPLSDFLLAHCTLLECPDAGLADLLQQALAGGTCLVILDGLDEIVSADARRDIVRRIEDFVRRYDDTGNRFVVTSRIASYRTFPLSEPFVHYTVQEMSDAQIQRFLERWCPAVEDAQTPDLSPERRAEVAQGEIDGIMAAIESSVGVRRMARNPLLLRVLALIHRTGARLPQKRIELYKLAADTLARDWRLSQGVSEAALTLLEDANLTRLLGKLAYWLHVNKPTGLATEHEVKAVLGEEWARINRLPWDADDPDSAITSKVDQFLHAVRVHTGLFVERAPKRYGFMHLTFEEYYVARYLVARAKTRAHLIRTHLHDPRWDEPILLALGFVGLDSPDDASELVESAILAQGDDAKDHGFTPSAYEHILGRDFLFALRCLGDDISVDPRLTGPLIERFVDELVQQRSSGQYTHYRNMLRERLDILKDTKVTPLLIAHVQSMLVDATDPQVRRQAVAALGALGAEAPNEVIPMLQAALTDADPLVRRQAIYALSELGSQVPGEVIPVLHAALSHADPLVRRQAIYALSELGSQVPDEVIPVVLQAVLSHADRYIQTVAARTLSQLGAEAPNEVIPMLQAALTDTDPQVQRQAVAALGALGAEAPNEVIPMLQAALTDADPLVRRQAIYALSELRSQVLGEVIPVVLHAALSHAESDVRRQAIHALSELGSQVPDEVIPVLQAVLSHADRYIQTVAARTLSQLGAEAPNEVIPMLQAALTDADPSVRWQAIYALSELGSQVLGEVIPVLHAALSHADPLVRRQAIYALSELGSQVPDEVIPVLHAALSHADPLVHGQAVYTLIDLRLPIPELDSMILEGFQKAEYDECWEIRRAFADVLGESQYPTDAIINALYAGLLDSDNDVRTACGRSLAKLGRRFPQAFQEIATRLERAISDPTFDTSDDLDGRSGHDYAFESLWMLVTGDVPEA